MRRSIMSLAGLAVAGLALSAVTPPVHAQRSHAAQGAHTNVQPAFFHGSFNTPFNSSASSAFFPRTSAGFNSSFATGGFDAARRGTFYAPNNFANAASQYPYSFGAGAFNAFGNGYYPWGNYPWARGIGHFERELLREAAFGNPYFPYGTPYNPYAFSNPYYDSSYANPYTAAVGVGNYGAGIDPPSNSAPAYAAQTSQAKQPSALSAFGIPSKDGNVAWPLAFRLMSPEARRELLEPIEGQLRSAATQAAAGKANPRSADDARINVARLRHWLRGHRLDLAEGTYAEADRFLHRMDEALDAIKAG